MLHSHNAMQPAFVLVDDALFDTHEYVSAHPERPERLHAIRQALTLMSPRLSGETLPPRDATHDELLRVHTEPYMITIDQAAGLRGHFDADTYYSPTSIAAARRAAGGAVALCERLVTREAKLGFALLRPPGHHATADRAMGFCLLNNVAVAAAHARAHGLERVAIVDWDVHHGNGTEQIFYTDPHVLYASIHQAPFYPGTGAAGDVGSGDGVGYTVNVPLSAGADTAVYSAAVERIIGPILNQYAPDLLLISAGFDAHVRDPLAEMKLEDESYAMLFEALFRSLPPRPADAALLPPGVGVLLEGGYDLAALAGSFRTTLEAAVACSDGRPAAARREETAHPISARHEADLERARTSLRRYWRLE